MPLNSKTAARRTLLLAGAALLLTAAPAGAAGPDQTSRTGDASPALPLVHADRRAGAPPVVVVVAQESAVLADFVVPYGVLAQSGAAKVIAVNIKPGPLRAGPLTLLPDMTAAEFDRAYPAGADYVIVPAVNDHHAEEVAWLRAQRAHGAALVSICDGVEVVAETGALDGRRATGHWASLPDRRKHFPKVTWLTDMRYVTDGDVASSAGVSAALPISLALVERIAGPQAARAEAARLGVTSWSAAHDSDLFKLRPDDYAAHRAGMRAKPETLALKVVDGDDELALAFGAEAWSRSMRTKVRLVSPAGGTVRLRGGLRVQSEPAAAVKPDLSVTVAETGPAGAALSADLDQVARRFGPGLARLAALGMEYPWGDLAPPQAAGVDAR